jgi:hypothetical protein
LACGTDQNPKPADCLNIYRLHAHVDDAKQEVEAVTRLALVAIFWGGRFLEITLAPEDKISLMPNLTPEQIARERINQLLTDTGLVVQDYSRMNLVARAVWLCVKHLV